MNFFRWLAPPAFETKSQTQQARLLNLFLMIGFGLEIIAAFSLRALFPVSYRLAWIFLGGTGLLTLSAYILMRQERLQIARLLLCLGFSLFLLGTPFIERGLNSFLLPLFTLVILMAGLLLGAPTSLAFAILGLGGILALQLTQPMRLTPLSPETPANFLVGLALVSVYLFSALIFMAFANSMNNTQKISEANINHLRQDKATLEIQKNQYEERLQQQATQLQKHFDLNKMITRFSDVDQLGQEIVKKITQLFPYEFAHIYFIDTNIRWAILKYSSKIATSAPFQGAQIDLQQAHGLSNAIRARQTQVTTVSSQTVQAPPQFIPHIHTEVTLPLLSHGKILGILHLQCNQVYTPTRQELDTLESIAGQVATILENAHLLDETQKQREEINRLNQFYLQSTWRALLSQDAHAFRFSPNGVTKLETPNETALEIAQKERRIHTFHENDTSKLIAPIIFQGQVLGALELNAPHRTWTPDEIVMIEAVLNQTALSLENTRLIFETRTRAEQEKMLGDISMRMRETLDLETILHTSVQEIQQGLQLSEVEIRLLPSLPAQTGPLPPLAHGE